MSYVYLARQPIVSIDEQLEAYEVMYLDANKAASEKNISTTASVINSILNKFGTKKFTSEHKAFIKVDKKFLMSDLVLSIPNDIFTLSLFSEIDLDARVIDRIEKLYEKGFTLAIDNVDLSRDNIIKYKKIMDKLTYFKINIYADMDLKDKDLVVQLQDTHVKIVATKIEDEYQYQTAKDLECDLYQGYWFAKPQILENEKFDPAQFNVLKIYNMLISDTNIDEITAEFENNHALTFQLLQFINSAHFHFQAKISSVHHILTLVGRKPLSEWLMLMIYSKSLTKNDKAPPLMLMVQNRTQLMQNLLRILKPDVKSNALGEAYLIGALSLVDTIFHAKLSDILEHIHISDIAKQALLHDEGTLGMLFKLVRAIEVFDVAEIVAFSKRHKVAEEDVQNVIMQSIEDVNALESSLRAS
ncbi:MAG: HDOD domain-containing protein [Sulfurimonas sp.]|nr:HDOD domain-containing protein [Sulfurimonas sp.]MDQ7060479.1 HDOD domain-containing protein [Sulfurimonas sp.]